MWTGLYGMGAMTMGVIFADWTSGSFWFAWPMSSVTFVAGIWFETKVRNSMRTKTWNERRQRWE